MSEQTIQFVAKGHSLKVIEDFFLSREKALQTHKGIISDLGGEGIVRVVGSGVVHTAAAGLPVFMHRRHRMPRGWGEFHEGKRVFYSSPDQSKAGKAMRKRIRDLFSSGGATPPQCGEYAEPGAEVPFFETFGTPGVEKLGGNWVINWPTVYVVNGQHSPRELRPHGAVPMKRSDYWRLREAQEAADASKADGGDS